jgi:hypothetical protein
MTDPGDLSLRRSPELPPPEPSPDRSGLPLVPIVIGLVALVAIGGWYWWRSSRGGAAGPPAAGAAPAAPRPPAASADRAPLPPLGEIDPLVRQLVSALSSHPKVLAWLTTDDLLRNVAVSVQNVADGASPARHLKPVAPEGAFRVTRRDGQTVLDPRSYQRYDGHADAVGALDAGGVARLYETLKPRLEEAYKELNPDGSFDATLQRAIALLVSTPIVEDPVRLDGSAGLYKFTDPTLEALTPAQRQLLRMGPRNMRIVQDKLREIARQLEMKVDP